MKLQVAGAKATGTGVANSQHIGISLNAKTFHTLSSALYKDKYGAIIREICSNAYDAHIMVGTPERPFSLTFPDAIDSELIIRDFGPGISPKDIDDVYCNLFESTKDDSNDEIGAFGLGSKTPYSYTDAFTVTSIHKGVKRVYTAFKDEGMPYIKLMMETETDEESGLEVSIPIDRRDLQTFEQAVLRELRFFPVKPISNRDWAWPESETTMDFGPVKFYKSVSEVLSGLFIQVGPVGYRVDHDIMVDYCKRANIRLSAMATHLLNMSLNNRRYYHVRDTQNAILNMPVGTVEVQPSREGLHYTNDTCQNIIDAISQAELLVASEMKQRLDDAYAVNAHTFYNFISGLPDYLMCSLARIEKFSKDYAPFTIDTAGRIGVKWDSSKVGEATCSKIYEEGNVGGSKVTHNGPLSYEEASYGGRVRRYNGLEFFRVDTVYVKDEGFAYKSRIFSDADEETCYFVEPAEGQDVDDLIAYLEQYVTIRRVSELPKNTKRIKNVRSGPKVRTWYDLGDKLSKIPTDVVSIGMSLYVHRVKEEFAVELNEVDVPTVVVRTVHNVLSLDGTSEEQREKLRVAAMLTEVGYKVIAIPKTKTYKNENLCELSNLTEDHHKALRARLEERRIVEALKAAISMIVEWNRAIEQMFEHEWLSRSKHEDMLISEMELRRALKDAGSFNQCRTFEDLTAVQKVCAADDIQIVYEDFDALFAVVNDHVGTNIVPSKNIAKLKKAVSIKTILNNTLDGKGYVFSRTRLFLSHDSVVNSTEVNGKNLLLEAFEGLD